MVIDTEKEIITISKEITAKTYFKQSIAPQIEQTLLQEIEQSLKVFLKSIHFEHYPTSQVRINEEYDYDENDPESSDLEIKPSEDFWDAVLNNTIQPQETEDYTNLLLMDVWENNQEHIQATRDMLKTAQAKAEEHNLWEFITYDDYDIMKSHIEALMDDIKIAINHLCLYAMTSSNFSDKTYRAWLNNI